jgi:hypothetical protein
MYGTGIIWRIFARRLIESGKKMSFAFSKMSENVYFLEQVPVVLCHQQFFLFKGKNKRGIK